MANVRNDDCSMVRLGESGRIILPAKLRRELALKEGDFLAISVHEGTIHLTPNHVMIQKLQAVVRAHNPTGISLSKHLLKERKREVILEERRKKSRG